MKDKRNSISASLFFFANLISFTFLTSCSELPQSGPQGIAYTPSQVEAWQKYLALSPLSNDVKGEGLAVKEKASNLLPPWYRQHVFAVAANIDENYAAESRFSDEYRQITQKYNVSKKILPPLSPYVYDGLRGNEANSSIFDSIVKHLLPDVTSGMLDANYRSELRGLTQRIWGPILAETRELIVEEYELTNEMRIRPTPKLTSGRGLIEDDRIRRLVLGVWKEGMLFPTVWVFHSDGTYAWEHPFSNKEESGNWQITQGRLTLSMRWTPKFGPVVKLCDYGGFGLG